MQELFGSVRRSLVFRTLSTSPDDNGVSGGFVDKIGSTIRKSRIGFFTKSPPLPKLTSSPLAKENVPPVSMDDAPPIRWRKGELIGCGAFGRVYMGMNLDSGELLAVKQVLIAVNGASKDKAQAHIRELEEEVKLLKNLSHPNIVRYLGTAREEEALNILLEFVPGGSIASLLSKFGSFPESVIRMYTKQLLIGLEYLHKNGIMHRDIKGANILVDNKGCIKLADFGASKKVVELATMTAAKSMKGTPYWMAPEVILQTGHTFSADIWSVACTVIEMATGKPPWCQYQEVAALFHIGTTKSPPPIPEHLSEEAKDFLLKCLQKEPHLRASASELLQHPFVIGEYKESQPVRRSVMTTTPTMNHKSARSNLTRTISGDLGSMNSSAVFQEKFPGASPLWDTNTGDDEMCIIDDIFDFTASQQLSPEKFLSDFNKSFNPVSALNGGLPCKLDDCHEFQRSNKALFLRDDCVTAAAPCNGETEFTVPCESLADDDDEVTESKIRAFLDEKALDLKKLQEGFYNTSKTESSKAFRAMEGDDALSPASNVSKTGSPVSHKKTVPESGSPVEQPLGELTEFKELQKEGFSSSPSFSERQRIWKEELDKELEMERERLAERLRQAGGKISSPNKRVPSQQRLTK